MAYRLLATIMVGQRLYEYCSEAPHWLNSSMF